MHEMSIATSLMDQLERLAEEQAVVRITEVEVVCGVMQQIVPEALQLAFEAVSADTVAAGAVLTIVEEGLVARCQSCGRQYEPAIDDFRCPACGTANPELLAGRDIVLRSVGCETEGEAAAS